VNRKFWSTDPRVISLVSNKLGYNKQAYDYFMAEERDAVPQQKHG
jgi:hypothetical protein